MTKLSGTRWVAYNYRLLALIQSISLAFEIPCWVRSLQTARTAATMRRIHKAKWRTVRAVGRLLTQHGISNASKILLPRRDPGAWR